MTQRLAALLVVLVLSVNAASAFEIAAPTSPSPDPELINGAEPTDPSVWPATFIFRSGGGGCTSTAIGQRVILTAAHCIEDGDSGQFQTAGGNIGVVCNHHPGYATGIISTDFALCLANANMTGFLFEQVSASIAYPRLNDSVVLLGYGCQQVGGHDANFGVLHVGQAQTVRRPSANDIYVVTRGGAAVCYGDSGGAAYFNLNPSGSRRAVVGVNSRGDISRYSFISSTATPQFVDWAYDWSAQHGVQICGLHVAAQGCR